MLAALDYAIALGHTESMRPFAGNLSDPAGGLKTVAEKLAFIRENTSNGLHFVGSCSAGKHPDTSVVDACFRVWGIDGLRVVDASVLPEVPGVNPQASILTIAELAAETMGHAPLLSSRRNRSKPRPETQYAIS
jgi:choline dehydrogenase